MEAGYVPAHCVRGTGQPLIDSAAAIRRARSFYFCWRWRTEPTPENAWLEGMGIERVGVNWVVYAVIPEGYAGGGPRITLRADDGAIVGVQETQ